MNELLTTLGFAWRTWDGRGDDKPNPAPPYWNVYLYLGLLTILGGYVYLEYITTLQAFGIYAVVLTYLLTGYRSLTLYWVKYHLNKCELEREKTIIAIADMLHGDFDDELLVINMKLQSLHSWYEAPDKGYASWHMTYRYVIAGAIICAILDNWNAYYLLACSLAGASFPMRVRYWNTEASARLTEGLLGAVMMGWVWLI